MLLRIIGLVLMLGQTPPVFGGRSTGESAAISMAPQAGDQRPHW